MSFSNDVDQQLDTTGVPLGSRTLFRGLAATARLELDRLLHRARRGLRPRMGRSAGSEFLAAVSMVVVSMVVVMLSSACTATPQSTGGETTISKWKDGKKAVYLLAFDDNLMSQLENVVPELTKRQIVGTFYVVPGGPRWASTEEQWEEAAKSPYVKLANHTFTHAGANNAEELDVELEKANEVLYRIYADRPQPFLLGYAQPGGEPWNVTGDEVAAALQKYNLVERPPFVGSPTNYSTEAMVLDSVKEAITNGEMGHVDMHGVGGDYLTTPVDWFTALLDTLVADKDLLWVPDVVSYHQYLTERQTAKVTVNKSDANEIRISLTSAAEPTLYDFPLTLTTKVPAEWDNALVTQDDKETEVPVKDGAVMYGAVPGAGEVRVARK